MNRPAALSVVIPCLNEAERLPLLLADLQCGGSELEILLACLLYTSPSPRD